MGNPMRGVNTAVAVVKKVAKQSTKVLAAALPAITIIQNGLEAVAEAPGDAGRALEIFVQRYTGVTREGEFRGDQFMRGTGKLLIAGAAGFIINQFA
jgi:hypothetical protein